MSPLEEGIIFIYSIINIIGWLAFALGLVPFAELFLVFIIIRLSKAFGKENEEWIKKAADDVSGIAKAALPDFIVLLSVGLIMILVF